MNKSNSQKTSLNVFFDTLGCAKNEVDTFKMEGLVKDAGYNVVEDALLADVIVLNTCAFIEAATQESIDTFFEYRNYYKNKKIIICGCLVSRYKDELKKSISEADAFISCDDEEKICEVIKDLNLKASNKVEANGVSASTFGYVKISEGCNRRCSYCTIPFIRGKYKSSSYDEIVKDVEEQYNLGVKEIVLVAQDCGVWGFDLDGKNLA